MRLTKRQKAYIKRQAVSDAPEILAAHLGLAVEEVTGYIAEAGLLKPDKSKADTPPRPAAPWWDRPFILPLGLTLVGLIAGIYCFDTKLYITGDNVEFIDLGELIRQGEGLGGRTKYPFLFPLLLAGVQALSNESLLWQKILVFAFYLGSIPLFFLICKEYLSPVWSCVLTMLAFTNAYVIEFSHYVMSEIPFLFFTLLGIFCVERSLRHPGDTKKWVWALVAVIAAYYTRTAGVAVIVGWVVFYFWHRNWKWGGLSAAGVVILALPWSIRSAALSHGNTYLDQLLFVNPYQHHLGRLTLGTLWERIVENLQIYFLGEIPQTLLPIRFMTTMQHDLHPQVWIGVILSGLFLAGLSYVLFQKKNFIALYSGAYLGIILLWPQVWSGSRFLIPLIPLVFFLTFYGMYEILRRPRWQLPKVLVVGIPIFYVGVAGLLSARNVLNYRGLMENYPPVYENYFKAAEWVRDNTPEDISFTDRKALLFKVVSQRKGYGFPTGPTITADTLFTYFEDNNITLMILPLYIGYGDVANYLLPLYRDYPHRFQPLYVAGQQNSNTETYVFHILPDTSKGAAN